MARNTSVILGDYYDAFVKEELAEGKYATSSEVIRAGLRKLEADKKLELYIEQALIAGEESGAPLSFDLNEFKARMKEKYAQ